MRDLLCQSLTGFDVAVDGSGAFLTVETADGASARVVLPADCLHQLLMTLPRIISMALCARFGDPAQRLVFPLTDWRLETIEHGEGLILTMTAEPGFDIAFTVNREDLAGMLVTADSADDEDIACRPNSLRVN
jgi:hypothetical protein